MYDRKALEEKGLTKEQIDDILDSYQQDKAKWKKDLDDAKDALTTEQGKVAEATKTLKAFGDTKPEDISTLQGKVNELTQSLAAKDQEYKDKIAARDFEDLLTEGIQTAKGKNTKAIRALLDIDALKASKNQKDDLAAQLKTLAEAEDSSMLFGSADPKPDRTGISIVGNTSGAMTDAEADELAAVMGVAEGD